MSTPIDPILLQAYRETLFELHAPHALTLRIGEPNPALRDLHRRHGTTCSAFLTAWNPRSAALPVAENERRQNALRDELQRRGLVCFEGQGRHPSNCWPPEHSLLVLGLDLEAAHELGACWEQNAVVWCGADAVPELIVIS